MPVMDGWEAIQHLREDPMTRDIPIVALSAYAFGDDPIRARDVGRGPVPGQAVPAVAGGAGRARDAVPLPPVACGRRRGLIPAFIPVIQRMARTPRPRRA